MNNGQYEYLNIIPSNIPPNDIISFNSMPLINFNIGAQERLLIGSSLKLTGEFIVKRSTGVNLEVGDKSAIDPTLGIMSCFEQLNISSKKSNQTIEEIRHYNRFLSSYFKAYQSADELSSCEQLTSIKTNTLNESNSLLTKNPDKQIPFSCSLPSGFFLSQDDPSEGKYGIPLSSNYGVGGILIQLLLTPSSNVIFAFDGGALPAAEAAAIYEIKNLRLKATVQRPLPEIQAAIMRNPNLIFNSISSHNTSITSSYGTLNFNLGLQNVLSAFVTFVKAANINSYKHGLANNGIQNNAGGNENIVNVQWLKNNMLYPNQFELSSHDQNDFYDPLIIRQFLNSINAIRHTRRQNSYNEINLRKNYEGIINGDFSGYAMGIGINYDLYSNVGTNFSTEQLGLIIESSLTDGTSNQCFLFVCSRQMLQMTQQGVSLIK